MLVVYVLTLSSFNILLIERSFLSSPGWLITSSAVSASSLLNCTFFILRVGKVGFYGSNLYIWKKTFFVLFNKKHFFWGTLINRVGTPLLPLYNDLQAKTVKKKPQLKKVMAIEAHEWKLLQVREHIHNGSCFFLLPHFQTAIKR